VSPTSVDKTVPRRRPGRPKGGQVLADRDQLLAAATRLINARGPDVTLDEIAAEATVTKPILYRTIGDKDALVTALSESLVDRINTAVADASGRSRDPRGEFEGALRSYFGAVDADRNLFLFVNAGGQGAEQLRRLVDRSAAQMIEVFGTARKAAGLDPSPARTWSYAIIGAFQTITIMWLRDEYCSLDDIADHLTQLFWPGVANIATP
jgi:AcrR family transcriptional regulator